MKKSLIALGVLAAVVGVAQAEKHYYPLWFNGSLRCCCQKI